MCGPSFATDTVASDVNSVIGRLDLTVFDSSVSSKRSSGKRTFADFGFMPMLKAGNGAKLRRADSQWEMSFRVISNAPKIMRLCFHDWATPKYTPANMPIYDGMYALIVRKAAHGLWSAQRVPGGFLGCPNDRSPFRMPE